MTSIHLTQSVSTLGGGISEVVRALSMNQNTAGTNAMVISLEDAGQKIEPWPTGSPKILESKNIPGMRLIPDLVSTLNNSRPDIVHTHGLWTYLSLAMPRWKKNHGCPYVLSPHGMLDEWALQRSKLKKKIASILFERRHLREASCLHALCQSEAGSIRKYGYEGPIAVIPNGVQLPNRESGIKEPNVSPSGVKSLLFLGRLHPKKGLKNMLHAWARTRQSNDNWQFVIAGWDQENHEQELKQVCDDLSLQYVDMSIERFIKQKSDDGPGRPSVVFTGSVFGDDKDALLNSVDAFVLPSFSEGLPVSVLEAWAYELPVLMTDYCNLPEGFEADAAIRIGTDADSLSEGIKKIVGMSCTERRELGNRGSSLVAERFTWEQVARQMNEMYRWILKECDQPDFITS